LTSVEEFLKRTERQQFTQSTNSRNEFIYGIWLFLWYLQSLLILLYT